MADICADCGGPIGQDKGPPDGWQLEDGRTVCHACNIADFKKHVATALNAFWAEAFNDEPLDSHRRMAAAIDTLPRPSA